MIRGGSSFGTPSVVGNQEILKQELLALFCSVKCPGNLIIKTYDLAKALRENAVPVIGGFHSPMEKECLRILLGGSQPVVVCPARNLGKMRIAADWKKPVAEGRLLLVSAFGEKQNRTTAELAYERNELVASIAKKVFIAYAAKGSKTEKFARDLLARGKPVLTFDSPENADLLAAGAEAVNIANVFLTKSP